MDWWAGMNSCVANTTAISDINQIEAIIFDPWNNCDELDLGAIQHQHQHHHQHNQHNQHHHHHHQPQQQQSPPAPAAPVNSTSVPSTGGLMVASDSGGPDCSCSPPGSASQHLLAPKLESKISHSVSSSVSSTSSSSSSSTTATENQAAIVACHGSESTNSSEYSSFGAGQPPSPGKQQHNGSLSILCQQQQQQPTQVQPRSRPQQMQQQQHQAPKVRRCRHITDYVLAEEEKRLLIKEGYTDFPMTCQARPLSKSEERILRKIRRKIRNKKSAQCSRQRKKEYVEDLERKYANILKENEQLKDLLDQIQQHHQLNNNNNHLPSAQTCEEANHNNNNHHHQQQSVQQQQQHNQSNNHNNHHQNHHHQPQSQQQPSHAQHLDMNSDWRRMFDTDNNSNKLTTTTTTTIDGSLDFLCAAAAPDAHA